MMKNEAHLLRRLEQGEKLDSETLGELRRQDLIEAEDVTNQDTPVGKKELLFTFITEKGKRLLMKAIIIAAVTVISAQGAVADYLHLREPSHTQVEINTPDTELSFAVPSVSGAFSEFETRAHFACPAMRGTTRNHLYWEAG